MALKFGPQWLRDLTDVGAGSTQPQSPSYGVKFKLADYRYGREEMLALYSDNYTPPEQVRKHQAIFSKDNQRPISLTPFSEDEQRLMSQGINSHIALRTGGRGGISDRGRGRGRGRGESNYISRQSENGDQPFGRQGSDGWEQVGRKPVERSFSRSFDDQAPSKREFLRSSSNNWRDKKEGEEEESSGGVAVHWRQTRENNNSRWGSNRPNWRQPPSENEESRPPKRDLESEQRERGPRKISDSYENEVPEWAGDDVGDDPGTFDSKGVFVSNKMGGRENHSQDHNPRKKFDKQDIVEKHESSVRCDGDRPNITNKNKISSPVPEIQHQPPIQKLPEKQPSPPEFNPDPVQKHNLVNIISNSMKGDGDSINYELPFLDKRPSNQGPLGPNDRPNTYFNSHQSHTKDNVKQIDTKMDGDHAARAANVAESENILRMEKHIQSLIAGLTANTEPKGEEVLDVSKGALPMTHKDAHKWFYRDPQGKIQGPFNSESMAEWFRIGYFTMTLIVKRGCDDCFKPLGELIKQYGRVPFVPGPPLPPLTTPSVPEEVVTPEIPVVSPVMTMPSLVSPMMPGMMGPAMPSLHDRYLFRSMMLQQEYLKQTLLMQQLQMQTLTKLQEQENFKDYTPDQQHDIATRMAMQNNPLLVQQMQQIQHQQLLLQQEQHQQQQQQRQELHHPHAQGGMPLDGGAVPTVPFQHAMSHPSMSIHNAHSNTSLPNTTLHNTNVSNDKETLWANSQHTENSIWSQPSSMWDIDNNSETSQAYKIQVEKLKREKEEEKQREEERLQQELLESKQKEIQKQQNELEKQREQVRREKEELERERLRKMEEVRKEEERLAQLELERERKERIDQEATRKALEKKQEEERKKREQELKKQEEKQRREEERMMEERRRQEEIRMKKEQEERQRQQELEELEARQKEEMRRQMEQKLIQEEEERMQREAVEKEKLQAALKKQMDSQRQQESLRKLQQAQKEQLANIQLPASSNWANNGSQGGAMRSKSLTEIQEEEARKERERQREAQLQKEKMQEQAAFIQQQQILNQKTWAAQTARTGRGGGRGLSLLDIQQQEKENAKKSDKGKSQNHQAKLSLGSGGNWSGSGQGLWGTNTTWESSNPVPVSSSIWDMGVPQSVKKPQLGKNSLGSGQNTGQQPKKGSKTNKKAAAPTVQKEVETVQKLFQNKKQDGFSAWVTEKLSKFSSNIDVPTFVSFIVDVDSPDDVFDYVKTYLGDNKETNDFARQFLEKRNHYKNQMRLQKQLEEDSIWGPAPAVNPHNILSSSEASKSANGEGGQSKSKNKKKKKAQKLDGSILGFTVHADSNRKNATGEFETIE